MSLNRISRNKNFLVSTFCDAAGPADRRRLSIMSKQGLGGIAPVDCINVSKEEAKNLIADLTDFVNNDLAVGDN